MDKPLVGLALAGAAWWLWHSRPRDQDDAIDLVDDGHGIMQPVCAHCRARMTPITRRDRASLAGVLAILIGLSGLAAILVNWLAGLALIIIAMILDIAGRGHRTRLVCPACGKSSNPIA